MAPYDSESSGGEEDEYTETNVLLGYASTEETEDTISQLGGRPTWLDPATPPSAALAKCKICSKLMVLLLQLNGDLPEHFPGHERRLYIFSCRQKACRRKEGSVRVVRGVRVSEVERRKEKKQQKVEIKPDPKPAVDFGAQLFGTKSSTGGKANPFGNSNPFSPCSTASGSNPFAAAGQPAPEPAPKPLQSPTNDLPTSFASALSLNNNSTQSSEAFGPVQPPEPWPSESDLPNPYPLYHLDADYESLEKTEDLPLPAQAIEYDEGKGGGAGGGNEDKDVFESTIDRTFQRFADRLSQNPEQVLRYEFKSSALLYSKTDAVGKLLSAGGKEDSSKVRVTNGAGGRIPRCSCGAGRVFELQLTPHAIMELEREEESLDGMEWGTVVVGVCESDCQEKGVAAGKAGYMEEWVGVQWEEIKR